MSKPKKVLELESEAKKLGLQLNRDKKGVWQLFREGKLAGEGLFPERLITAYKRHYGIV